MLAERANSDSISPESLLSGIASGNRAYEKELVTSYWKPLFFVLNRHSQDKDLAADVAQETLLTVIQAARQKSIQNPNALSAFIRQTGLNILNAHYRKETRRKTSATEDMDTLFEHHQPQQEKQIAAQKLVEIVTQVIDEMTVERDKVLLREFYVTGKSKSQLCLELELSEVHFDRVLFRAKQRLKQVLQTKLNVDLEKTCIHQLLTLSLILSMAPQLASEQSNQNPGQSMRDYPAQWHFNPEQWNCSDNSECSIKSRDHQK